VADEEFARQLAREDVEAAAVAANSATVATTAPQSAQTERKLICLFINEEVVCLLNLNRKLAAFSPSPPPVTTPAKNINIGPLKSGNLELAKDNNDSSNQDEGKLFYFYFIHLCF
jgi:hypothetical protein